MFDEKLIAEAARRLSAAAPQARVILFGSHARGDAGPGSDLDFLVIQPAVDDPAEESVRLRRTLRGLGVFADVVVVSEREAEDWRDVRGSLIHSALSEGRPLAA
jgi:predicted nucleotidyltransferase